jgi:hypothetical protein
MVPQVARFSSHCQPDKKHLMAPEDVSSQHRPLNGIGNLAILNLFQLGVAPTLNSPLAGMLV